MPQRTLFYNGRIVTLDPRNPRPDALAVVDGRVAFAGDRERCRSVLGPGVEEVDLQGAWTLPSFTDSHIHFSNYAAGLNNVAMDNTASMQEALELVRQRVQKVRPGEWVVGGNWDLNRWAEQRPPDRHALDAVSPENPVALHSRDGHSLWVNSRALQLAGINADSPDPDGGQIVREPGSSEPSGWLLETARGIVYAVVDAPEEPLTESIRKAFPHALATGITSIHDFDRMEAIQAYRELHAAGELRLRVLKTIPVENLDWALDEGIRTYQGDEWFRFGQVKIFTDGALGSHSAAMLEPYNGEPENTGIEVTPPDELRELVLRAARGGLACALHAIGDKANRNALDAFRHVRNEGVGDALRHRIEHVQHIHPDDLPRLAQLGVIASVQPIHQTSDMFVADRLLGPERARSSYAWRSLLDTGARLAFGSDCPVEPFNPFLGLHAAVTRQRDGKPEGGWQPQERLSAEEAYRAFTEGAAWTSGEEGIKGRLSAGMLADFVQLSDNPLECAPDNIKDVQVLATYVGGQEAYRA
ncbi:MAG: amidohydrolase [Chloroflexota bacterium]|nr:amidohydrolase [Chloroflexota bacterium]